jgi:hypothetical protein
MKAYFPKGNPTPCLVIESTDKSVGVSIAADDSCGALDSYRRFYLWYWDKTKDIDEDENGLDFPKLIFWLIKIRRYERRLK